MSKTAKNNTPKQTMPGGYYLAGIYEKKLEAESDLKKLGRSRHSSKIITHTKTIKPGFLGRLFGEKPSKKKVYLLYLR